LIVGTPLGGSELVLSVKACLDYELLFSIVTKQNAKTETVSPNLVHKDSAACIVGASTLLPEVPVPKELKTAEMDELFTLPAWTWILFRLSTGCE